MASPDDYAALPNIIDLITKLGARVKALEGKPAPAPEVKKADFDALGTEVHNESLEVNKLAARVTKAEAAATAADTANKAALEKAKKDAIAAASQALNTALEKLKKDPAMRGPKGADGKSVTFTSQKIKPTGAGKEGALVYCTDDGHLYSSNGKQYTDLGKLKGEDGKVPDKLQKRVEVLESGQENLEARATAAEKVIGYPMIVRLAPTEHAKMTAFTLEVHGRNFVKGSKVGMTGQSGSYYNVPVTFKHDTLLLAAVENTYTHGDRLVQVTNPDPDPNVTFTSNEFPFKFTEKG